jgi:hypothetical protein
VIGDPCQEGARTSEQGNETVETPRGLLLSRRGVALVSQEELPCYMNIAQRSHPRVQAHRAAQLARLSAAAAERERTAAAARQRDSKNRLTTLERECCTRC